MREAPRAARRPTASARPGSPCSRKAASTSSNPPWRSTRPATARTESFAEATLDPCAKMAIPVFMHGLRHDSGWGGKLPTQKIDKPAPEFPAVIAIDFQALQKGQQPEHIQVASLRHSQPL